MRKVAIKTNTALNAEHLCISGKSIDTVRATEKPIEARLATLDPENSILLPAKEKLTERARGAHEFLQTADAYCRSDCRSAPRRGGCS